MSLDNLLELSTKFCKDCPQLYKCEGTHKCLLSEFWFVCDEGRVQIGTFTKEEKR